MIIECPGGEKIKVSDGFPLIETSKLKRYPHNVKIHTEEQIHDLIELIKMVGFKDPIVIDEKKMIFAGHGRLDAAQILKMPKVPFWPLGKMTEEQKKIVLLMDNKVNESAWIKENVQVIYNQIDPINFEKFEMKFDNFFEGMFEGKDAITLGELPTDHQCPKCGYSW